MIDVLRQAIYARLTTGTPLGAGVDVFDYVPQGEERSPPYVYIGDTTVTRDDTDTSHGMDTMTELEVFSDYAGSKEAAELLATVRDLFHNQALTVTGATVVLVMVDDGETRRGPDDVTREGVVRVRVLLDDIT